MKTTLKTTAKIQNLSENPTKVNSRDFFRAFNLIKEGKFTDYDTYSFEWFELFFDKQGRQWAVEEKVSRNKCEWALTVDGEKVISLGKFSRFIENFIEQKKREEYEAERDYHENREELFRHYNYGMI